jgi:hypothetical protein
MPFTLLLKSASAPHTAAAQAHQQHLREQPRSAMAQHADRPISDEQAAKLDAEQDEQDRQDEQAVKAQRQHPRTGRWMGATDTAFGATGAPIVDALARHQAPASPVSMATAPAVSLGSSIAPGSVTLTQLDYRQGLAPVVVNTSPIRPDFHNGVRP